MEPITSSIATAVFKPVLEKACADFHALDIPNLVEIDPKLIANKNIICLINDIFNSSYQVVIEKTQNLSLTAFVIKDRVIHKSYENVYGSTEVIEDSFESLIPVNVYHVYASALIMPYAHIANITLL